MQTLFTGLSTALALTALLISGYSFAVAQATRARCEKISGELAHLRSSVSSSSSTKIAAELAELVAAVEVDRLALRKQLGKVWGRIGREEIVGPESPQRVDDPEFEALLALQNAHGSN